MRISASFGVLALASTLLIAACGSNTARTTTMPSTVPAALSDGTGMAGMDHSVTTAGMAMSDSTAMAGMDQAETGSGAMVMNESPAAVGLTLSVASTTFEAAKQANLSFKVLAQDGSAVTVYQTEQTKELHLVLVRSDLTGYQHLHPTRSADGTWSLPVTFESGGTYRMVADFVPVLNGTATGRTAINTDVKVVGPGTDTPLPPPSSTATADGYTVTIAGTVKSSAETSVTFAVVDSAGRAAMLEPYLGSYGHLVAFAERDLAYTHIHPNTADQNNGKLEFLGQVAAGGPHRLFLQFAAGGSVHTAAFTVNAA